jgi:hypothetical protein
MSENPSIPTFQPAWHAAGWFGGTIGSTLWIMIYAIVIFAETGSPLYGSLCLAAGLTVVGFAWYLWTKQESVAYGVAMQVTMGMAGLAGLAAFALGDLAGGVGYPLASYWWVFLLFPLLGWQLSRTVRITNPKGPLELVHRFLLADTVPSAACSLEGDAIRAATSRRADVSLFRLKNVSFRNCVLLLRANVQGEGVTRKAYLEMDCTIAGKGTFFSKALQDAVVGTQPWRWHQAPFYLCGKEECEEIQIKMVFEGGGQIWVKDIELYRAPI